MWARRVLVVEDQAAMRVLVVDLLQRHGFEVVGAASPDEALEAFDGFDPDALVADIDLGTRPDGVELATLLRRRGPHLGVVLLSSYPRAATGLPAAVFVGKSRLGHAGELIEAIERSLGPTAAAERIEEPDAGDSHGLAALTRHQIDVLAMVARGWSNEQVAERSGRSVRAVERSVSRIFDRLGVGGDPELSPRVAAAARYLAAFGPAR